MVGCKPALHLWGTDGAVSASNDDPDLHRTLVLMSQLGFTMLGCILGGFGLGFLLDKHLGTFPVFLILFLLVGIAAGFWRAYALIMRVTR